MFSPHAYQNVFHFPAKVLGTNSNQDFWFSFTTRCLAHIPIKIFDPHSYKDVLHTFQSDQLAQSSTKTLALHINPDIWLTFQPKQSVHTNILKHILPNFFKPHFDQDILPTVLSRCLAHNSIYSNVHVLLEIF